MQTIAFCNRCRGMNVGWNRRYVRHRLSCTNWISKSPKVFLTVIISILVFTIQAPSAFVSSDLEADSGIRQNVVRPTFVSLENSPVVRIQALLEKYAVNGPHRSRVAEAIAASSGRFSVDPRLVASIMIVESGANPFAISDQDSVGIMQIHVPTWGQAAVDQGINLFKIEDNVEFGVRILDQYMRRYGFWQGVKRYRGWNPDSPTSAENAEIYAQKVQRIYFP